MKASARRALLLCAGTIAAAATVAAADWLQPDISYREAQLVLKMAARDTAGHGDDPGRLDSLGVAALRLGWQTQAESIFRRVLTLAPDDAVARAGLGKLALVHGRLDEAEAMLAGIPSRDPAASRDLFSTRMRAGRFAEASSLVDEVGEEGRAPVLERLAARAPYAFANAPARVTVPWVRAYPIPLIRVKLNGQSVVMALDTGASDLIIDESAARRYRIERLPAQRMEPWTGSRIAVKNAMVQKLELGGLKIENLPAGTVSLRRWGLEVNPQSEPVAGVIGIELLRRFMPTLDYRAQKLELRPHGAALPEGALKVPFELWGTNEMMVYGTLSGGRRMAMVVQTGVPGCGVGAPEDVFQEVGVKPGAVSRLVKGAGQYLQGRPWASCVVPAVAVGPIVKDRVAGWQGALDSGEIWRHGMRRDALLSSDFFRDRRFTIDWKAQELLFEE